MRRLVLPVKTSAVTVILLAGAMYMAAEAREAVIKRQELELARLEAGEPSNNGIGDPAKPVLPFRSNFLSSQREPGKHCPERRDKATNQHQPRRISRQAKNTSGRSSSASQIGVSPCWKTASSSRPTPSRWGPSPLPARRASSPSSITRLIPCITTEARRFSQAKAIRWAIAGWDSA